jgi:hypothetical protein
MSNMKLTLTAESPASGSVIINNPRISYGKVTHRRNINQTSVTAINGKIHTRDYGGRLVEGSLSLRFLSPADFQDLRLFIEDTINLNEHSFTIEITDPPAVHVIDLGQGFDDLKVEGCNLGESVHTSDGIFDVRAPGIYHMNLPFTYAEDIGTD